MTKHLRANGKVTQLANDVLIVAFARNKKRASENFHIHALVESALYYMWKFIEQTQIFLQKFMIHDFLLHSWKVCNKT